MVTSQLSQNWCHLHLLPDSMVCQLNQFCCPLVGTHMYCNYSHITTALCHFYLSKSIFCVKSQKSRIYLERQEVVIRKC